MFRLKKKAVIALFFLFIPFVLVVIPSFYTKPIKTIVTDSLGIFLKLSSSFLRETRTIITYRVILKENIKLKQENERLKQNLIQLEELTKENERLRDILSFKKKKVYALIVAQVIGKDPSNWSSSIILDKGNKDKIKEGAVVITPLGLVGRIIEVNKSTSKVILITDPNLSVAVVIQRSRQEGIACGTLDGKLIVRYLPEDSDIKIGDTVLTSGTSSLYREGIFIGRVIQVHGQPARRGMYAIIQPAVNFNILEEVLISLE